MRTAEFIRALPLPDSPLEGLEAWMLQTNQAMAMFFELPDGVVVPEHAHGAQWGVVLQGSLEFTIGGETRSYGPGDTYAIPAGVAHSAVTEYLDAADPTILRINLLLLFFVSLLPFTTRLLAENFEVEDAERVAVTIYGLNLLLASLRFKKPVLEVTWATLPMLGILAIGVLLITYVPWLTLGILHWMGRV